MDSVWMIIQVVTLYTIKDCEYRRVQLGVEK
ncbi:hypothetical protein J2S02_004018 [Metabacillus niabensis]|uniref:Uncharacterized protein n=1 Tax=Metabacillus niabensis TaxID=324854 RepID=A0ABT9Z5Z6_9BACI|nr:hypothetical protein [Metabacillus niabensis]